MFIYSQVVTHVHNNIHMLFLNRLANFYYFILDRLHKLEMGVSVKQETMTERSLSLSRRCKCMHRSLQIGYCRTLQNLLICQQHMKKGDGEGGGGGERERERERKWGRMDKKKLSTQSLIFASTVVTIVK